MARLSIATGRKFTGRFITNASVRSFLSLHFHAQTRDYGCYGLNLGLCAVVHVVSEEVREPPR